MHPPPFRLGQRLSDWPDCCLELHCCRGQPVFPVRLLIRDHGDRTFAEVLTKLRCKQCRKPPARSTSAPDTVSTPWALRRTRAIELVPAHYPEGGNQISTTSSGSAG